MSDTKFAPALNAAIDLLRERFIRDATDIVTREREALGLPVNVKADLDTRVWVLPEEPGS